MDRWHDSGVTPPFTGLSSAVRDTASVRVLVVDDEPQMVSVIARSLVKEGLATDVSSDGEQALSMAAMVDYDALVLDVMLPGASGFEICRRLREQGVWSAVLMLTARDAIADRVEGLDCGADDYLVKPFALAELHARLRSLVRRGHRERPVVLTVGDLYLDPARHQVRRGDVDIELSAKEFALLEALMRRPGEVLSRLALIESAWDLAYETRSNIVDVYVRRLRLKIDGPFDRCSIQTVQGVGYRLGDER